MKSYKDHLDTHKHTAEPLNFDPDDELTEGALKNLISIALIAKIRNLSASVKTAKTIDKKFDLIASQNAHLAALMFTK